MLFGKKLLLWISLGMLFLPSKTENKITILDKEAEINIHLASKDITGSIGGLTTKVFFDPDKLYNSYVHADLKTESVRTGSKIRDIKLMSKKFLYKKKFPTISFRSTKIMEMDHGYIVNGKLTIRDVTKKVSLDIMYSEGIIAGFASINLMDFGIEMTDLRRENKLDVYIKVPVNRHAKQADATDLDN